MNVRLGTFTECGSRARGFRREGLVVATRAREKMCAVNVSVEAVIASGPESLRSSQVGDAAATAAPAAGREARAVAMAVTLGATGKPVCESHDSTGEPGAGNRPAGFGERGEETCLRDSDCGPARKRRMSHRTLPVTRLPSTLLIPATNAGGRWDRAACANLLNAVQWSPGSRSSCRACRSIS